MADATATKPRILVLGGLGVLGRNFIKYLVDNKVAGSIRVVDKRVAPFAFLSADHKAALAHESVEFLQCDLSEDAMVEEAFDAAGGKFDLVYNFVAETKHGQADERYEKGVLAAAKTGEAARAAAVKRYIHVSTAAVYKSSKGKACKEDAAVEPWHRPAEFARRAELALEAVAEAGLPLVIVRPAVVYGPGDEAGLMPRAVCAVSYKLNGTKMEFLWGGDLHVSTVHVFDVCRALWTVASRGPAGKGVIYNLADAGYTTQEKLGRVIAEVFGIETGFHGSIVSGLASLSLASVVAEANDMHMGPWLAVCKANGTSKTPLTPFIHEELLRNNHLHIDGTKICEVTGFAYRVPELSAAGLKDSIARAIAQGIFPATVNGVSLGMGSNPGTGAAAGGGAEAAAAGGGGGGGR